MTWEWWSLEQSAGCCGCGIVDPAVGVGIWVGCDDFECGDL